MPDRTLLFAAGDPGGSRALLPLIAHAAADKFVCLVRRHGYLGREITPTAGVVIEDESAPWSDDCGCYIYGSSTTDTYALRLASKAKRHHIPTIHVCDNWSSYQHRLILDGQVLLPDVYCVMDHQAREDAIREGIPPDILAVTGQPALGNLARSEEHTSELQSQR